jgi:hypothetical protein
MVIGAVSVAVRNLLLRQLFGEHPKVSAYYLPKVPFAPMIFFKQLTLRQSALTPGVRFHP